jgi:WD40 repeat protein/serine/threonine protein kinase
VTVVAWSEIVDSDLFSWFNMSESERSHRDGVTTIKVEPGGFQEFIGLWFDVDARDEVVGFRLSFDRYWLDNTPTGMASAADLAASVVRAVASTDPVLADVASALMARGLAASQSQVIVGPQWEEEPLADRQITAFVRTFTHAAAPAAAVGSSRILRTRNVPGAQGMSFRADWFSDRAPERRAPLQPMRIWEVNDVIADLYEVRQEITTGGMGQVYRVWHRGWNMELAVKVPKPELVDSPVSMADFEAEAQTWVDLGLHPNVVSCVYVRRLDGLPRVFAEWVDGGSLADAIARRTLYTGSNTEVLGRILDVAIQFAWGLQHAHAHGLIHQDVKPANTMLTTDGVAKVTDFGLARARAAAGERGAAPGADALASFSGMTPAYCSAEQGQAAAELKAGLQPQPLTRATDVWSWAISVLEMFFGEPPCLGGGQTAAAVLDLFVADGGQAGEQGIPPIPAAIAELLRRCFALDPEDRPADMGVVADELARIYAVLIGVPYPRDQPKPADVLADGLNNQALSMLDLDHPQRAEQLWRQALDTDPHHLHAVYNYGLYRWRDAQITDEQLIVSLDGLRPSHPDDPALDRLRDAVRLERGEDSAAAEHDEWSIDTRDPVDVMVADGSASTCLTLSCREYSSSVRRFDVRTRRELEPLSHEEDYRAITAVGLSADGTVAVTAGRSGALRVWDVRSGTCARTLEGHVGTVSAVGLSGDGRIAVSAGADNTLRIWTTKAASCQRVLSDRAGVVALAANWSGSVGIAAGSDATALLWQELAEVGVRTLTGHAAALTAVALTGDGTRAVTASLDGTVRIWDTATGRCLGILVGHAGAVSCVAVSGDGSCVLTGGADNTARLWDPGTGRCLRTMTEHSRGPAQHEGKARAITRGGGISAVALSGDARIAVSSGHDDTALRVWKDPLAHRRSAEWSYAEPRSATHITRASARFAAILVVADRCLDTGRGGGAVAAIKQARAIGGFRRHPEVLSRWRRLGRVASRGQLESVWQLGTWQVPTGEGDTAAINDLGTQVVAADGAVIRVWDVMTGELQARLSGHRFRLWSVAVSPDGRYVLAGGASDEAWVWHVGSAERACVLAGHATNVRVATFSADSRAAITITWNNTVRIFNAATGQLLHEQPLADAGGSFTSIAIERFGCGLVAAGDAGWMMSLWNVADGQRIASGQAHLGAVRAVAFAGADRLVTAGDDNVAQLWDLHTGTRVHTFQGHSAAVESLMCSADGKIMLTGARDGTFRIWSTDSGDCLSTVGGDLGVVHQLGLSSDAQIAMSATRNDIIQAWALDWDYQIPRDDGSA